MFYSNEKLVVLIDGKSLYAASRTLGFDIDFKKLRAEFARRGHLKGIVYFTAVDDAAESVNDVVRPLIDWLSYNGYQTFPLRSKLAFTGGNERRSKDNVLMELAVRAIETASWADHLVIFSGNNDLTPVVRHIQQKGVSVTIASTLDGNQIADELRRQADNFIEISQLRTIIEREPAALAS